MTFTIHGISASKGIAIGRVHAVDRGRSEVVERRLDPSLIEAEIERFGRAVDAARLELRAVKARIPEGTPREIAAFIDTHLLMLEDEAISRAPIAYIREMRCNAEWALKLECDALVAVFDAMDDPYLRTRKDDVEHVVNRVQLHLRGERRTASPPDGAAAGRIIYADDLTPADTVLMQHQGVAGFMTEFGGPNSHTAILARSLNIPAVVGLHRSAALLRDGDEVVLDGRRGIVIVSPADIVKQFYERRRREIERIRAARRRLRATPTVTADGAPVVLQANVELPGESAGAVRDGAAGVGLYRTEFLYMNRSEPPDEQEQFEAYATLVAGMKGAPVTIRTLDLGADKQVDGTRPDAPVTSNPALGLRAVRLCLKEQEGLFRPQIRAILRASASGPVRMMIPMLANTTELDQVLRIVRDCKRELDERGEGYDASMPVGAMIEVPAAAICADIFARRLDFLSIGTNDLIQYTIAIDRVDDEVSYLYDPLHPAVLRLVATTIAAGRKAGIPVAMCGEMAGDARYTKLLLGMGLREFSVHPNALLEVKQIIGETRVAPARRLSQRVMRSTHAATRHALVEELNRTGP